MEWERKGPVLRSDSEAGWGGEGNEVKVPSSIPSCFAALREARAPFFSRVPQEKTKANVRCEDFPDFRHRDENRDPDFPHGYWLKI